MCCFDSTLYHLGLVYRQYIPDFCWSDKCQACGKTQMLVLIEVNSAAMENTVLGLQNPDFIPGSVCYFA